MEFRPMQDGASLPPPPVLTPEEFASLPHDDLGPTVLATTWTFVSLSLFFLVLRLYCKLGRHRGLWWDDYILIASWLALTGSTSIIVYQVRLGYGKHIWDIPVENFIFKMPLPMNISGTLAILAAAWSKTSFAVTLLRVSQGWMWALVWCIIVSMNIALGLSALFIWIQCTPIEKSWNFLIPGTCYPMVKIIDYLMISTGYSGAMDIVLALLPWKLVWPLNMRKKEKIGVIVAMSMGVFAGITAMIKVAMTPKMKEGDVYHGVVLIIWSTVESGITIMAASVPVLRSLLRQKQSSAKSPNPETPESKVKFAAESFTMQSQSTVVIESRRVSTSADSRLPFWRTSVLGGGGGSDDKAYSKDGVPEPAMGQILQVSEVAVEYHDMARKSQV